MRTSENGPSTVALVQNSALGALLLWKFGTSYQEETVGEIALLPCFFLVLPLLFHSGTLDRIRTTFPTSGLSQLAKKLGEERELLVAMHGRTFKMRGLTLESIGCGISTGMLHLDYATGRLRSNEARAPKSPERLKHHIGGAEKLGRWFARLTPDQVFSLLWVEP